MSQLGDLYTQAVNSGDTAAADYYAKALYAQANPGADISQVTAASPSQIAASGKSGGFFNLPQLPTLPAIGDALLQGILHPFDTLSGNNTATMDAQAGTAQGPSAKIGGAIKGTTSALAFLTDIPRLATTIIGLVLIIAGIFALTKGQTIIQVARDAAP